MSGEHSVQLLCEALLVSRSGYYQWKSRRSRPGRRAWANVELQERIRQAFARSRQTYGSPRLAQVLGCPGSHNRIARLMRAARIQARRRSKFRAMTTDSRHGGPIAPNRLPECQVTRPDQAWVTDATCVLTGQGWLYVVAVLDVYTRRIVGWAMSPHLDAQVTIDALRMAINRRTPAPGLLVHSDRGMQFASAAYRQVLTEYGLVPSMSRKGNCYDNAYIESFWSSLKHEVVWHRNFATHREARTALFDYIESFYNRSRLHSSLGYLSPSNFESQLN